MTKFLYTTAAKQAKQSLSKTSGKHKSCTSQWRIMTALRMACRIPGLCRKRRALGFAGFTSVAGVLPITGLSLACLPAAVVCANAEGGMPAVTQTSAATTFTGIDIDALIERLNQILGIDIVNDSWIGKSGLNEQISALYSTAVMYESLDHGEINFNGIGGTLLGNVKAGAVSASSNQAINGSQLHAASEKVAAALGGGVVVDAAGNLTQPTYTIQNRGYSNIGAAFEGVNTSLGTISGNITTLHDMAVIYSSDKTMIALLGENGTKITNVANGDISKNSKDAVNGGQLKSLQDQINSLESGEDPLAVRYDSEDKDTVTLNKDGGSTRLTNVAAGTVSQTSTDVINGSQLYTVGQNVAAALGGGAGWNNGNWAGPNFTFQTVDGGKVVGGTADNVQDALSRLGEGIADVNNRVDNIANDGGHAGDGTYLEWKDDGHGGGYWDAGTGRIGNVGNGEIADGSRDAVNGGQFWENNKDLNDRLDGINDRIDSIRNIETVENAIQYDVDENGDKTGRITLKGSDEGTPAVIDNVGDGRIETGSGEAVNGGQLHDYVQVQREEIISEANAYTDMRFNQLNSSIRDVRKEARQAAAIGLAAASLRYNDDPGKLSVAFGSGWWQSESALAFGVGYTSDSGKFRSNLSATSAGGDWGVGAGLSITLN